MTAVAERIAIRADTETESTEWVKKERFLGKIPTLPQDGKATADEEEEHKYERGEVRFGQTNKE